MSLLKHWTVIAIISTLGWWIEDIVQILTPKTEYRV